MYLLHYFVRNYHFIARAVDFIIYWYYLLFIVIIIVYKPCFSL